MALWIFGHRDQRKGTVDLPQASTYCVLGRSRKQGIELVAEARRLAARIDQGCHLVVYRTGDRRLNDGNIRASRLKQCDRIRVVEQRQQQVIERNITVRALLRCVAGPP